MSTPAELIGRLKVCVDFAAPSPDTKTYLNDGARTMLREAAVMIASMGETIDACLGEPEADDLRFIVGEVAVND